MAAVLTSWKSIAQYMGTGVRTVQRWTSERGFPVRGTGSGHKRLVIAMTEEIDAWVHSQSLHASDINNHSEPDEALQERIASLQSEIRILRLRIDVMRMRKEEDVLCRSARLLELSSLLQQESRVILERCRSTRTDYPLTLSLLNDSYPKQKTSTRAGKTKQLEINPVFLNGEQFDAPAVLQAYPSPSLEDDAEYPDSADAPPDQLSEPFARH